MAEAESPVHVLQDVAGDHGGVEVEVLSPELPLAVVKVHFEAFGSKLSKEGAVVFQSDPYVGLMIHGELASFVVVDLLLNFDSTSGVC